MSARAACSSNVDHLLSQLRLKSVRIAPTHRLMIARVGLDLRPVQAHRPNLQHSHRLGNHQYLHEQPAQRLKKPFPRAIVSWSGCVSRDVAKRHRVVRRLFELAAGEHPCRISVKQQRHHHRRMVRRLPPSSIRTFQLTQIPRVPNAPEEASPATRGGEDTVCRGRPRRDPIVNSRHSCGRPRILSDTALRQAPR